MVKSTLKLVAAIVLFASCNQFEKAPSGMTYKIKHGSGNEKLLQAGQYVKLHIEYKLKNKDSVLSSTFEHMPVYFPIDTAQLGKYTFTEILMKLRKGDKVDFNLSIDTLVKMNQLQFNEMFKKGDVIIGKAEILNVFTDVNQVDVDYKKEQAIEKDKEIKIIKDHLAKNKINATQTPEGVFIVIKNAGDTTVKIDTTKQASVNYKGYNLKGEVFDTNMKPNDSTAKPYAVRVGDHGVIPGWEIALTYFAKGGSGTIFVPAMLAYGPQANGSIKAYENLAFDIEIKEVIKKPAQTVQPMLPEIQPSKK